MAKNITFSLTLNAIRRLDTFCIRHLRKKSNVIEKALLEYIDREEKLRETKSRKTAV